MKVELVRNSKGDVVGTYAQPTGDEVPVEADLREGDTIEEAQIRLSDLANIEGFYSKLAKPTKKH